MQEMSAGSAGATTTSVAPGGESRLLPRLLTPVLAVVPWWMTIAGVANLQRWYFDYARRLESMTVTLLAAVAVLLVAAVIWGALSAWSSAGTLLAGGVTVLWGFATGLPSVMRTIFQATSLRDLTGVQLFQVLTSPVVLVLLGSLLLAAGLGAAGARRLARR